MPKVYIVGDNGCSQYASMFSSRGWELTTDIFEADLFQFTGGEDVTPAIYGEDNTGSYNNFSRDIEEAGFFAIAKRIGKPMVGICRGGQFLNVMCGGSMIQHIDGHTQSHMLYDARGKVCMGTSTHHQMMRPSDKAKLLAWGQSTITFCDDGQDPEVVYYEHERALCFQPHPEYKTFPELEDYYFDLINNLLLSNLLLWG